MRAVVVIFAITGALFLARRATRQKARQKAHRDLPTHRATEREPRRHSSDVSRTVRRQPRPKRNHRWSAALAIIGGLLISFGTTMPWWERRGGATVSFGSVVSLSRPLGDFAGSLDPSDKATVSEGLLLLAAISVIAGISLLIRNRSHAIVGRLFLLMSGAMGLFVSGYMYFLPEMLRNSVPEGRSALEQFRDSVLGGFETSVLGELKPASGVWALIAGSVLVVLSAISPSKVEPTIVYIPVPDPDPGPN